MKIWQYRKRLRSRMTIMAALLLAALPRADAANTDGAVAFNVTMNTPVTGSTYGNAHIDAVWIEDGSGRFIQTILKYQGGNTGDLTQWNAQRGANTSVDGITSATVSGTKTWNLTWHCRDTANAIVPDGAYYIRCEYVSTDGNGPYMPSTVSFVKGTNAVSATFPNFSAGGGSFSSLSLVYTPLIASGAPASDIAITGMTPASGLAGSNIAVQVTVTNLMTNTVSFIVALSNVTSGATLLASSSVAALAGHAATTVALNWNTAGLTSGIYQIKAVAGPVSNEVNTADNSLTAAFTLGGSAGALVHDVSINEVDIRGDATIGDIIDVIVTAYNLGNVPESFAVTLRDMTASQTIGTVPVTNLPVQASAMLSFAWNTRNNQLGSHSLRAQTSTISGDTNTVNNTRYASGFVSTNGFNLHALDTVASLGGRCGAVALLPARTSGEEDGGGVTTPPAVVAGLGSALVVMSVSNPASPAVLGSVRLPGLVNGIAVLGTAAYVACGDQGVHVVDLANRAVPVHRNTYKAAGNANAVCVQGRYLYIAEGGGGIRIMSVSSPLSPTLSGTYKCEGPVQALAVVNHTLYAVDQYAGLQIIDVTTSSAPVWKGAVPIGFGNGVAAAGSTVYMVDASGVLSVIAAANVAAPLRQGMLPLAGSGKAVVVAAGTAYVAAGSAGLQIVNVGAVTNPVLSAGVDCGGEAVGVAVTNTTAYVAAGFGGLRIFNVAASASPSLLGSYLASHRAVDLAVAGTRVYVAAGDAGLDIYSITNPAAPRLLGVCSSAGNARSVAIAGSLAYIADGQYGLRIVNVGNPASIVALGLYAGNGLGPARCVAVSGTTVLVADGHQVQRLNVANPATPVYQGSYAVPGYVFGLAISGSTAAVAVGGAGLLVLDVSGSQLTYRGQYQTPGPALAVSLSGHNAYVGEGKAGWQIIDLSSPAYPRVVSSFGTPAAGIASIGATVTVVSASGLVTAGVSKPLTPVSLKSVGPLFNAMRVAAYGNYVYAAQQEAGVAIVDVVISNDVATLWAKVPATWKQQILDASLAAGGPVHTLADVNPNDDFDGDGLSNLQEYLAGTSPVDPNSVFALRAVAPAVPVEGQPSQFVVQWSSVAGKTYSLYKSTDLTQGWTLLQSGITATPPMNNYTDAETSAAAFYMVSTP